MKEETTTRSYIYYTGIGNTPDNTYTGWLIHDVPQGFKLNVTTPVPKVNICITPALTNTQHLHLDGYAQFHFALTFLSHYNYNGFDNHEDAILQLQKTPELLISTLKSSWYKEEERGELISFINPRICIFNTHTTRNDEGEIVEMVTSIDRYESV